MCTSPQFLIDIASIFRKRVLRNPKIDEARQKARAEIVDHADQRAANVLRQIQRRGNVTAADHRGP
jgi:hypothetical protein